MPEKSEKKRKLDHTESAATVTDAPVQKRTQEGDETEYFEWMKRAFPGLFSSFHSFKSARAFVAKMKQVPGRWEKFCASMDKCCVYTDPSLDRTKVMLAQNAVASVLCGCSNPKVPALFLDTCLKMTVPNSDGVPTLIRSKSDAGRLHAGFANLKGSKAFSMQATASSTSTVATKAVKKSIPKKKGAVAKKGKDIKVGVAKDAVLM